jgi:hypothetical protein
LRGVGPELDGGLIGGRAEVSEEVAHPFLTGVDDLSGGGGVDGGGYVVTELLKAAAQLLQEGISSQGRFGGHDLLQVGWEIEPRAPPARPNANHNLESVPKGIGSIE